ncbi:MULTISPECIES: mannose-1-phosphate guanylyltransferase/mannose-6-phosphate isomerase [Enterobacteriaceae]|jgi:mannose-1-phosphate guanylyltransferase|uniref:mannose-1-phosphate guanylyltransferase/mannose-6-phosphate isomerase n=1 Tax=Enterobacteriaceae TaxID=543 RepID=UPI000CF1A264|nr:MULTISPECIES: mannose-1-phosphate guanylyltransferase/mannose-6-phosphate isomerase [Enterobacteriaceae]MCU3195205.1 mannose-1-phosphate guanylyltransferase/mannose-6-phosphate isomerase [Enterobacter hormaechei subsp. hoffmannii]HED2223107.1 mannose-1-phosphate guanylyltransferase/mannose-6-phosphate isomerase [Enterobacter hormaechei subsp. steigerwaltii]ELM8953716.1 mannose-1-phosphate guanylyltransferase/mannose-6-phosphate isomerase [Escherichia coli]MBK0349153.1 mannose-1-phosphate gua
MKILPVIMAGGSGTRLWPLSRSLYPKQFLSLVEDASLLQATLLRLDRLECSTPLIISNNEHRFIVAEQLRQAGFNDFDIILEPVGRNTAPAIALAALHALKDGDDPIMLVLAADHVIQNVDAFCSSVILAQTQAAQGKMVTFGIVPSRAETGYGYIRQGEAVAESVYKVDSFVEKPDQITAETYIRDGNYLWNSGMFMFKASAYLDELEKFRPDILSACKLAMASASIDLDFIRLEEAVFTACPDDSVDYAVMEKTNHSVVVPMDAQWCDVGSWNSLWDISTKDGNGNVTYGDVIHYNSNNNYVYAESSLVTTIGADDLVIVQTKDALLIAKQNQVQDIKKVVDVLKRENRSEHISHREEYRPWGRYDSVDQGGRYQVKRITVKPGERLSTQMHYHRAEHWVVVAGTAKVTRGDEVFIVTENESMFIPVGVVHTLENPGKVPLEVIEIQSGTYLGSDDIVRFDDKYGRIKDNK